MIPALPFNNQASAPTRDFKRVRDRLEALMPKPMNFCALGAQSEFASSKASLEMRRLTLVALAHTPYRLDRTGYLLPEIWIPFSGRLVASDGRSEFHYGGSKAYFCNSEIRNIQTTTISALGVRFDPQELKAVHSAMVGASGCQDVPLHSRLVELDANGVDFLALLRNLLRQVDALQLNAALLERLGVDDSFHRLLVGMFMPDLLAPPEQRSPQATHAQQRISRLCDYLAGHLNQPIGLTDMERISGLSARVLQYNFQKTFGMRPKQWLRKQRIHAARAVLLRSDGGVKLTALAYEYCFPSPSTFSRAYQMEFGELPSETLARKRVFDLL
jgi:AraC-like DNA-binding protein